MHTTITESIHTTPNSIYPLFKHCLMYSRIVASRLNDTGMYICIARNPLGNILLQARLTVQGRLTCKTNSEDSLIIYCLKVMQFPEV